jgi:hypothetical protein
MTTIEEITVADRKTAGQLIAHHLHFDAFFE